MKKITTSLAALALLLFSSGCMTNGMAKVLEAVSKDTNSFRLKVNGWGVSIDFDRNAGGTSIIATDGSTSGVTLVPTTTLQVQRTK